MGDGTTCHECRRSHRNCTCPDPVSQMDSTMTEEPVCPHCGKVVRDTFELADFSDGHERDGCGKVFSIRRIVLEYWTTRKQ